MSMILQYSMEYCVIFWIFLVIYLFIPIFLHGWPLKAKITLPIGKADDGECEKLKANEWIQINAIGNETHNAIRTPNIS